MQRRDAARIAEPQRSVRRQHRPSFDDLNWIDSTAAAVGEMIYNLAKAIGSKITPEIASCVYAALLTDTGSFHFSNTTERTFKIASELVRHGAQPAKLSQ